MREQQHIELQQRIEARFAEMLKTFENDLQRRMDEHLNQFEGTFGSSLQQKAEGRLKAFETAIMKAVNDNASKARPSEGPRAQEVQELSKDSKDPYGLIRKFNNPDTDEETLPMDYGKLVVPLVKAVQELSDEIERLKSEIKDLESKLEN